MNTETMFTLGRKYALSGQDDQQKIVKHAMTRMRHWTKKKEPTATVLFSCFVEGARSAERDFSEVF